MKMSGCQPYFKHRALVQQVSQNIKVTAQKSYYFSFVDLFRTCDQPVHKTSKGKFIFLCNEKFNFFIIWNPKKHIKESLVWSELWEISIYPPHKFYLFKVSNRDTRKRCGICPATLLKKRLQDRRFHTCGFNTSGGCFCQNQQFWLFLMKDVIGKSFWQNLAKQ